MEPDTIFFTMESIDFYVHISPSVQGDRGYWDLNFDNAEGHQCFVSCGYGPLDRRKLIVAATLAAERFLTDCHAGHYREEYV